MKTQTAFATMMFAALTAASAGAQDLSIDKFQSGAYSSPAFRSGIHSSSQNGGMMGGNRSTTINVCTTLCSSQNPFNQVATYTFQPATKNAPAAFVSSAGFYAGPRIDMGYGFGAAMQENFGGYDRIRLNFLGLAENLNFNIQLFTGTSWAQGGCNIAAYAGPFSLEVPLASFNKTAGFDQTAINYMNFIFQSGSAVGAVNFAVTSIEVSNTGKPGALSCHY